VRLRDTPAGAPPAERGHLTGTGSRQVANGWPSGWQSPIAVIGAGIAGLVAAYELEQLGYRVVVLEGSYRVGGRIYTHRFGTDEGAPTAELGAMRIPADHALTMRYVDALGLRSALRPFQSILSDQNNYLRCGSTFVRVGAAAGTLIEDFRREIGSASYRHETMVFCAWLGAIVRVIGPRELRDGLRADIANLLPLADRIDLSPHVHSAGRDRIDLRTVFRDHPELRSGCSSRLDGFLDDILTETGTDLLYLKGGMSQLTDRLSQLVRGPILIGQEVVSLDVRDDQVLIRLQAGRRSVVARYPVALCTLPFSVLRGLALTGFDAGKLDVIRTVEYGAATKVALHCRDAFWVRDGILGGASATGGRTRQTYYPPLDGDPSRGAVLLGSYAIAEDADLLGHLPAEARHAAVIEELALLHPELRQPDMVLDAASLAWGEHRWSNGCTARRWGKDAAERADEMSRAACPQGKLFFAGEHCSSTPGWINGAIESALAAVAEMDAAAPRMGPERVAGTGR
jgi:monoamine oxidase